MARRPSAASSAAQSSSQRSSFRPLLAVLGAWAVIVSSAACGDQESPVEPNSPDAPLAAVIASVQAQLDQIDAMRQYVESLVDAGVLESGQASGLLALLERAANSVDRGNGNAAARLLEALIHVTEGFMRGGQLSEADAEPILNSAGNLTVDGIALASITAGHRHACGLTTSGKAYCWGANDYGQLGDGSTTPSNLPVPVAGGMTFASLEAAGEVTCGLTGSGDAYCWGMNVGAQLGDGTTTNRSSPVAVSGGLTFSEVSVGTDHVCGLTFSDVAYCWGGGPQSDAQDFKRDLGLGFVPPEVCTGRRTGFDRYVCTTTPLPVNTALTFVSIAVGEWHTCGLRSDGSVYCWGWNALCELGLSAACGTDANATLGASTITPSLVAGAVSFESIHAGAIANCGITATGVAHCWGPGTAAGSTDFFVPTPTPLSGGVNFASINISGEDFIWPHACGVATNGAAYCWGSNWADFEEPGGHLGNGLPPATTCDAFGPECTPMPSPVFGGIDFAEVATGKAFSCGVATTGETYCWGLNDEGQLGTSDFQNAVTPVRVAAFGANGASPVVPQSPAAVSGLPSTTVVP
ncbi:MAG: RCC1 domain-containing protein [Planctomycetota bacterium]|jgi:alpha-tubulin suppressor-like RCC1 family protein